MAFGNRHYAKLTSTGEEVIIIGYRSSTNDALVAFPSAFQQDQAALLRQIVSSNEAQRKDYLMDAVGGNILGSAHHPSGIDWQTYLLRQAAAGRGNGAVRRLTLKDLEFYDPTQKAFFLGYGPSIEPEIDALRQGRLRAQQDAASGRSVLPEPSAEEVAAAQARQRAAFEAAEAAEAAQNATSVEADSVPTPTPAVPDQSAAVLSALTSLAQAQNAIMERLEKLETAPAKKTPTKHKTAAKKRPYNRKPKADAVEETTPVVSETEEVSMTASSYGGDE